METSRPADETVEEPLLEALEVAESPKVRYHIRESLQLLHLEE